MAKVIGILAAAVAIFALIWNVGANATERMAWRYEAGICEQARGTYAVYMDSLGTREAECQKGDSTIFVGRIAGR